MLRKKSTKGTAEGLAEMQQIGRLFEPTLNLAVTPGGAGADVTPLTSAGVPGAGLLVKGDTGKGSFIFYLFYYLFIN